MNPTQRLLAPVAMIGVLTMSAMPAIAATPAEAPQSQIDFKSVDINQDGNVSKEEFMALGGTEDVFLQSDINSDKNLDKEELEKAKPAINR